MRLACYGNLHQAKSVINHRWRRRYVPTMPNNAGMPGLNRAQYRRYSLFVGFREFSVQRCRMLSMHKFLGHVRVFVTRALPFKRIGNYVLYFFPPPLSPLPFLVCGRAKPFPRALFVRSAPATFCFPCTRAVKFVQTRTKAGRKMRKIKFPRSQDKAKFNLPSRGRRR